MIIIIHSQDRMSFCSGLENQEDGKITPNILVSSKTKTYKRVLVCCLIIAIYGKYSKFDHLEIT